MSNELLKIGETKVTHQYTVEFKGVSDYPAAMTKTYPKPQTQQDVIEAVAEVLLRRGEVPASVSVTYRIVTEYLVFDEEMEYKKPVEPTSDYRRVTAKEVEEVIRTSGEWSGVLSFNGTEQLEVYEPVVSMRFTQEDLGTEHVGEKQFYLKIRMIGMQASIDGLRKEPGTHVLFWEPIDHD